MDTRVLKKQLTAAYQYSYTRLALNYYTFFETMAESTGVGCSAAAYADCLNRIMTAYLAEKKMEGETEKALFELRTRLTQEVEVMTAYTDCFQIYEYVLNRMERRFRPRKAVTAGDDEFSSSLLAFITNTKDTAVMNGRIAQIIGQLPIRFTKQKFFGLVSEGLSVYTNSPRQNLDDMMYVLRTESMLSLPEGMEEGHEELFKTLERFRQADFKEMTAEGYEEASANLIYACDSLTEESDLYVMMQEIVNDLCVLALSKEDAVIDVKEEELYEFFLKAVAAKFSDENFTPVDDRVVERFMELEGRQEAYYERYLKYSTADGEPDIKDPDGLKLFNVGLLLSGSSFVKLMDSKNCVTQELKPADRAFVEQTAEGYYEELAAAFKHMSRPVIRAVMAKVLSSLPIYFNSIDEIDGYIRGSLAACTDEEEKETCKELLEELMDDENNLV